MGGCGRFATRLERTMNHAAPGQPSAEDRQRLARMANEAAAQLAQAVEIARELGERPPAMTLEQLDDLGGTLENWGLWVANGCQGPMPGGSEPERP